MPGILLRGLLWIGGGLIADKAIRDAGTTAEKTQSLAKIAVTGAAIYYGYKAAKGAGLIK